MTMRLGIVAEFSDRASKRMRKLLRFNRQMEKINKAQVKQTKMQSKAQEKVTRATETSSRAMRALRAATQAASATAQAMSRGVQVFTNHISTAIRRVNTLRRSLDLAGRSRRLAGRGAGLVRDGGGRLARGAVVAGGLAVGAAGGAALAANAVIGPAAQMENYQIQLEALYGGSKKKADQALEWISDFATRTPIELPDVVLAFRQLKNFGIDPTNGSLQALVDTMAMSGGNAETLQGIILAVGQAWTKGKLQGEEAMQLLERGIPVWHLLSEATGKSAAQLQELASKGKLGTKAIAKLVELMGRRASGASQKMSKTWDGMISNMSDMWFRLRFMIAKAGLFDFVKSKLREFLDLLNRMQADGSLQKLAETISANIITTLTAAWEFGQGLVMVFRELGGWLSWAAEMLGGWNRLAVLLIALPLISTLAGILSGVVLLSSGLITLGAAALGLVTSGGIGALRLFFAANMGVYRLLYSGALMAVSGITALGRALVLFVASGIRGAITGLMMLGRGLLGLPASAVRAAFGLRALALSALGLPGRLFAVARSLAIMALSGLRALPGLLMGVARGFATMALAGLGRLPGLLLAAGRAFMMLGAGLMATPIGWFIAGIAAIAGAAYLIYENWEPIRAFFSDLWGSVLDLGAKALDWFASLDFASVIPDLSWSDILTVLDWASWILPVRWLDLIPGFSWKAIISSVLDWAEFIPFPDISGYFNFEWTDILPEWDWGSIIPDMPGWINPSSWFSGAENDVPEVSSADPASLEQARAAAEKLDVAMVVMRETAKTVPAATQAALSDTQAALASVDFTHHGQRMMETIAAGMRARAHLLVSEIQRVTQKIRDHLPSSPAKTGPLSDIHRLKFSETMAQSIRAEPLVRAMRNAAAATVAAASLTAPNLSAASPEPIQPSPAALAGSAQSTGTAVPERGSAGQSISISFNPRITIQGGSEDLHDQIMDALDDLLPELSRKLQEVANEDERLVF